MGKVSVIIHDDNSEEHMEIVGVEESCGEYDGIHIIPQCTCELVSISRLGDVRPPSADASSAMREFYKERIYTRKSQDMMKICEVEEIKEMEACELETIVFLDSLASRVDVDEPRQTRSSRKRFFPIHGVDDWQWRQQENREVNFFKELYRKMKKNNCKYPGELINGDFGIVYSPTYRELPRRLPHGSGGFGPYALWIETYAKNKKAWHDAGLFKINKEGGPHGLDISIHERCLSLTAEEAMKNLNKDEFPGIEHIKTSTLHEDASKNKLESLHQVLEPSLSNGERVIVVCDTLDSCRAVVYFLSEKKIPTVNYHDALPPEERVEALNKFKSEDCKRSALICKDQSDARGLGLLVDHVVMFNFPLNHIYYLVLHVRALRMSAKGKITSLVTNRTMAAWGADLGAEENFGLPD